MFSRAPIPVRNSTFFFKTAHRIFDEPSLFLDYFPSVFSFFDMSIKTESGRVGVSVPA